MTDVELHALAALVQAAYSGRHQPFDPSRCREIQALEAELERRGVLPPRKPAAWEQQDEEPAPPFSPDDI